MSQSYPSQQARPQFFITCQICGKQVRVVKSRLHTKFCSYECRNESYKKPVVDGKKQCANCSEWKLLEEFNRNPVDSTGRASHCKACTRPENLKHAKNWFDENRDQHYSTQKSVRARKLGASVIDFSADQWESLKERYGQRCAYCGIECESLTVDHVIPLIQGGQHIEANIVPACRSCNARKGNREPLPMVVLPERFP